MKFTNTSAYSSTVLKILLKVAFGDDARYVHEVRVTGCADHYRGRCYVGRRSSYVLIRIAPPSWIGWLATQRHQYRETVPYDTQGWKETFVAIAAHEASHARQGAERPAQRQSEVMAEHAAVAAVKRYRENEAAILVRLTAAMEEIRQREELREVKEAARRSPAARANEIRVKIASWETKRKRAETYLRKYRRQLRRLEFVGR